MKILLNGELIFAGEGASSPALANNVDQILNERQLVLTGLKLDGLEVSQEELPVLLGQNGGEMLELSACTPVQLVREALEEAGTYLPRLVRGLRQAAASFLSGREGEGIPLFLQAIDGLRWFQYLAEGLFNFGRLVSPPSGLAGQLEDYRARLSELLAAWENKDYLLIGDLLDYEIATFVEYFVENLELIKNTFQGSGDAGGDLAEKSVGLEGKG